MDSLKYSEILKANNLLKKEVEQLKPYRVRVLSNITCNQLAGTLTYHLCQEHVNPLIEFGNFDNIVQDSFALDGYDLVIVHYELYGVIEKKGIYYENFTDEDIAAIKNDLIQEWAIVLQNISHVPCAVVDSMTTATMPMYPLRKNKMQALASALNEYIQVHKSANTYWLDTSTIIAQIGLQQALDWKLYNISKTLYSVAYWKTYTYLISPILLKVTGHAKKAIIFDCDNTLWKGILGEDGADGIDMSFHSKVGSLYHAVQGHAVWLSQHGVLIGLCSKNNADDVAQVLGRHVDMALRDEHIVVSRVNWNDKATNLQQIAADLNIGLDSMVFVDDSDFEINLIREQLPEVLCMQVPSAIHEYPHAFQKMVDTYFFLSNSKDDLDKTNQYKQQAQRNQLKASSADLDSFLSSLNMELTCHIDMPEEAERVAQLTQKTNQFNLCTNRYTLAQIEEMQASAEYTCMSISVRDKFGDSGLTGVAIMRNVSENVVEIVDMLMSCRIMGRNIELAIMDYVIDVLVKKQILEVRACYRATVKNKPVADYYDRLGFEQVEQSEDSKTYRLQINRYKYNNLTYIKIQ